MQIAPISFLNINKISNINKIPFKGTIEASGDTFEKSFNKIFSPENLRGIFLNPENEIGHGANNVVYSIPDNDKFVLRVCKSYFRPENITSAEYVDTDQHEDFNIGQKIGHIKADGGPFGMCQIIEVLKKQKGKSYGVPHISAITDEGGKLLPNETPYDDYSRKISFKTLLDKASKMDIGAYEKLLEMFDKAQDADYGFDPFNCNNLLLSDDEINMIDFNRSKIKCSYLELLNMVTNHEYLHTFYMAPDIDESLKHQAYEQTVTIISKFLKAMQNKGLKLNYEYLQNRESMDLLRCYEFQHAIGYDENSGLTIPQHLENMGLFDSTLENSKLFF